MEVWKDIAGYEGLYQVSSHGNVRSLNWGNRGFVKNLYLKPHNKGYLQVELSNRGIKKMHTVHRLVALAFVPGYSEGLVVNHLDENKQNNRCENLEWCTTSENTKHSCNIHPQRYSNNGKHRHQSSRASSLKGRYLFGVPIIQCDQSGKTLQTWSSPVEIRNALGYSDWSIRECCRGKRKQAYGYIWQYANFDISSSETAQ